METLNKAILLGLSIGFINLAFAENFKDYSVEPTPSLSERTIIHPEEQLVSQMHFKEQDQWTYEVSSKDPSRCGENHLALQTHFNEQDQWIHEASSKDPSQCAMNRLTAATPQAWQD